VAPAGRSEKAGALSEQFMWEPVGREPGPIRPRAMRQDTHRADREANSSPRIPRSALGQVVFSRPRLVSRHRAVMADRARTTATECFLRLPRTRGGIRGGIGVLALSQHPRHRSRSLIGPISYPWAQSRWRGNGAAKHFRPPSRPGPLFSLLPRHTLQQTATFAQIPVLRPRHRLYGPVCE
jgi:hypothetical protein